MTFKTNLEFIGLTIFIFCLPLGLFLANAITNYSKNGELYLGDAVFKTAIFFGLVCLFTIPGFLLHYRYYINDKEKYIRLRPTYFELIGKTGTNKIYYGDISKVEKHYMAWNKLPWRSYGYINVILSNGNLLSYNCLTHDHLSSALFFKSKEIPVEECEEIYPWQKDYGC